MSVRSIEDLIAAAEAGRDLDYVFFWGHTGRERLGPHVLSQWYPAPFEVDGATYATAEHWMMAEKARRFGDEEVRAKILASDDPARAKKLGRQVRGFDGPTWNGARVQVVTEGNRHKFGQHPELQAYLRETGGRVLVEASPVDLIWGIGFAADAPEARDPRAWRGLNLLGFALMQVRAELG